VRTGFSLAIGAALAWGALSAGAFYPWAYWPLAAACALLGAWGLASSPGWRQGSFGRLALAFGAVAAAIAVQIIPLPYAAFIRLSPAAGRFLSRYSVAYSFKLPAWHALSVVPAETLVALGLFVALALFVLGAAAALGSARLDRIARSLMLVGVLIAVIGVVEKATAGSAPPLVYGFWHPKYGGEPFGTFFNRNHFAGWMVMALPVVLGYAFAVLDESKQPADRRWFGWLRWATTPDASQFMVVAFSALTMGTALVLTGSRSGLGAFAVALAVFAYFAVRRIGHQRARRLAVGYLVLLLAGAVIWAGAGDTLARFEVVSADMPGRLGAWRDALHIFHDFPVFGAGLGTFGALMLVYQTGSRIAIFFQAHNDYLQLLAEGGVLVSVPATVAAVMLGRTAWRRLAAGGDGPLTYWMRVGAVAGAAGIAAQSLFDYSLQRPGNTALCALLLALAIHRPGRQALHAHRI
jgi:O-antigen ligase